MIELENVKTWQDWLSSMYAYWTFNFIKTRSGTVYGLSLLDEKYREAKKVLPELDNSIQNRMWRDGKCVYCNSKYIVKGEDFGDHIIPELKKKKINIFNVPCCPDLCNNSKSDNDLLIWWTSKHPLIEIRKDVMVVYLKAKWYNLNLENKLLDEPNDISFEILKHLKTIVQKEIEKKKEEGDTKIKKSVLEYLKSSLSDWMVIEPYLIDKDVEGYDIPVYDSTQIDGLELIYPVYQLELKPNNSRHCQLCGMNIDREWYVKNTKEKQVMVVGGICWATQFDAPDVYRNGNDPFKILQRRLIIEEIYLWRKDNNKEFWDKRQNGYFSNNKKAWNFFTNLNSLNKDESNLRFIQKVIRDGINLGFVPSEKLVKLLGKNKSSKNIHLQLKEISDDKLEGYFRC